MTGAEARHTFVVPAYMHASWLERCVESLQAQTRRSTILITTSTPNAHVNEVASRLGVPLIVNPVSAGIASDWNFALTRVSDGWVTLAHQDDWYAPGYVSACLAAASRTREPLLAFSAAGEAYADGNEVRNSLVKRLMCDAVFVGRPAIRAQVLKRLLLSFGNPIPCPAVMINRSLAPGFTFQEGWCSNLDWAAWLDLAGMPGAFVYVRQRLVLRRVHAGAATVAYLAARASEDDRVLRSLWPAPLAAMIGRLYGAGRRQYDVLASEEAPRER